MLVVGELAMNAFGLLAALSLMRPAPELDAATQKDVRCFAVLSSLAETGRERGDQELAEHASSAATFFLSRIRSRSPSLDLTQALTAEAAANGTRPASDFIHDCIDERLRYLESVTGSQARPKKRK